MPSRKSRRPGSQATTLTQAGVRRRRSAAPRIETSGDTAVLRYNCSGTNRDFNASGLGATRRIYIPGFDSNFGTDAADIVTNAGTTIASYYSSAKFLPGTKIRWEPSCSFTTAGRVFVGFCDNPEVVRTILTAQNTFRTSGLTSDYNTYANYVKALGSTISFPVWQETEIPFPTRLRRKRFDIDESTLTVDSLDRNMQTAMFVCLEGGLGAAVVGNFWYHDVLEVEGLHAIAT
jgi:hypothetical protein